VSVVSGPAPRRLVADILRVLLAVGLVALISTFLCYRFGDSDIEKAEKLFAAGDLAQLKNFAEKKLRAGEVTPMLFAYYACAEYSLNTQSRLESLLGQIKAVDERPVFRREALERIWKIEKNRARAPEIFRAAINLERPIPPELQTLILSVAEREFEIPKDTNMQLVISSLFSQKQIKGKNVQFRQGPSTSAAVLRRFTDGETVGVRRKVGEWIYVLDRDFESGWVFIAYIK